MGGLHVVGGDLADRAIASAAEPAAKDKGIEMRQLTIQLGSGRPAALVLPVDVTDRELLGLVAAVLQAGEQLHAERQRPRSRLHLPRGRRRG